MALICRGCHRELLEEEMPADPTAKMRCPQCQSGKFIAVPDPPPVPSVPYELSVNDKRFLKKLGVRE